MNQEEVCAKFVKAAAVFDQHEKCAHGVQVASSLNGGLTILKETLYLRLHQDVENLIGMDSMLIPVSEMKTATVTKHEIELYQVAECAATVKSHGLLAASDDWFLTWLIQLRLNVSQPDAPVTARLTDYLARSNEDRAKTFSNVLARTLPESRRAPLVLFQLYPLAVELATVLAFNDREKAAALRKRQATCLPAILDCGECRGRVLENGEQCRKCGNPLWKANFLTAAD